MKPHMKTAKQVEGFTSLRVSKMTGATLRQLQWWDEQCVLKPLGGIQRHSRVYSVEQVEVARRMVLLRKAGVSLQNLRKLAESPWAQACKAVVVSKRCVVVVGDTLVVFQGRAR